MKPRVPFAVLFVLCCSIGMAIAGTKLTPSGPLKAYKGPEGEIVVMIEVSDGKEMLVQFRKIGGDLEGKTQLYLVDNYGKGNKDVYVNKKRGSKTYRSVILTSRELQWELYIPGTNTSLRLKYSEETSDSIKIDDVLKAYKP